MGLKEKPPVKRRDNDADERKMAWAKGLRARYDKVRREPVPNQFRNLLKRIDAADSRKR